MKRSTHIANHTGIILSIAFLLGFSIMSFVFPVLNRNDLNNAYHQNRELSKLPPLTKASFLKVKRNRASETETQTDPYRYLPFERYEVLGEQVLVYLDGTITTLHVSDICYPISDKELRRARSQSRGFSFTTMNGERIETTAREMIDRIKSEHVVSKHFWLGTDQLGRDMLSRLLAGGKISLTIAFIAVLISLVLGVSIGTVAGYYGGWIDRILTWFIGLFWAIPGVLFVVILALAMGSAREAVIIGISFVMWVEMAQVVKGRVKEVRATEYVRASRLIGLSHMSIIRKHILPNITAPIFILAASAFADALMLEAGLSFLGIGITPPDPSWGNMIRTTYGYMLTDRYAYMAVLPALMLFMAVLSAVFLSNGLKVAFEFNYRQSTNNKI